MICFLNLFLIFSVFQMEKSVTFALTLVALFFLTLTNKYYNQEIAKIIILQKKLEKLEIDLLHKPSCNVTIVTAYYRMKSKHSYEEYLSWMSNFLTLQDCMVIFTEQEFVG